MSLLINESYANPAKSLWLPVGGGSIIGNLVVSGDMSADNVYSHTLSSVDPSGNTILRMANDSGVGLFQTPSNLTFAKVNATTGNTSLTLSAAGAGLDLFQTNFLRAIGPIPTPSIPSGTPQQVTLATGSPSRVQIFPVTTVISNVPNAEYDVQFIGSVYWDGTGVPPAATDLVTILASFGGGINANVVEVFYPGAPPFTWVANVGQPVNIRSRLVSPNAMTTLTAQASFLGAAGTGNIVATCSLLDVVRVA